MNLCPICEPMALPEEAEPVYDHQPSGTRLWCECCGLSTPFEEGMEKAATLWVVMTSALKEHFDSGGAS